MEYKMTVEELVRACDMIQKSRFQNGKVVYEDIVCCRLPLPKGVTREEIKARKPEILEYIRTKREAEEQAWKERRDKINSIPGLNEIRAARADVDSWHRELNASFEREDCGGLGVRPAPKYDFEDMYRKYPVATAFLKIEGLEYSANYELAAIGKRAKEALIENPENYAAILETMEKEQEEFADRHFWD